MVLGGMQSQARVLEKNRAWAETVDAVAVSNRLVQCGIRDAADIAAIAAAWDEQVIVDRALAADSVYLLYSVSTMDQFSAESASRIRKYLESIDRVSGYTWDVVSRLAVEDRAQFRSLLAGLIDAKYPGRPVYGAMALKYNVLEGKPVIGQDTELGELVDLLFAAEPMDIQSVESIKRLIKDKAIALGRHHLRAIGKTFVAQGDVNPLAEVIRPTVDALNAAGGEGLEKALRDIGGDVGDRDRGKLLDAATKWQHEVMVGELLGNSMALVLGRISVALGVEGFNAFVDDYNNGTGTSD